MPCPTGFLAVHGMKETMAVVVAAGLMLAAAPAHAIDILTPPNQVLTPAARIEALRNGQLDDLQILQNRQDRLNFQLQQQQFRDQDRQAIQQQTPLRLKVPRLRQPCQPQVFGNAYAGQPACP